MSTGLRICNVKKQRKYKSRLNMKILESVIPEHALIKEEPQQGVQKMFIPVEKKLKALAGSPVPITKLAAGVAAMLGRHQINEFINLLHKEMRGKI